MWVYRFIVCFKQKTAYEMRISDWCSDVCSSDLLREHVGSGQERRWIDRIVGRGVAEHEATRVEDDRTTRGDGRNLIAGAAIETTKRAVARVEKICQRYARRAGEGLGGGKERILRSDERREGKECVSTCRSRWSP